MTKDKKFTNFKKQFTGFPKNAINNLKFSKGGYVMEVFKITYDDSKTGNSWRATVIAMNRDDAEKLLHEKVPFPFVITGFEEVGKVDAFSNEALSFISFIQSKSAPKKRQYRKRKIQSEGK